ncbi:T9SS C-terminal target domain-containing protein [Flavobacteriaceae bacterium AU392]|nr:T9SS C-terminal target domain-containing protein [Flavobacteriaceae bacterium]RKM85791.1 T9SS C-terminal target domain-containing protein [Flavobacteriaceae bacterium AU392]
MKITHKYLFIILLTLSTKTIFAQLYVENSSYVFVNDQVLYVEDDINLNNIESSIFLRTEAQLIQGSGITGNSGIGSLSLYQEGNVDAYEFNYWCSPIGDNSNSNFNNNPFGITFLNDVVNLTTSIPAGTSRLPGFNGTASPLNIEPFWIFKFVAGATTSSFVQVQANTSINPGEGFTMKGTNGTSANNPGNSQRYDFKGKPNNGNIDVTILKDNLTLVGNPYPSALDAAAYIHDSDNALVINGTLFYWEQDLNVNSHNLIDYQGGYATYTIDATGTFETFVPATFNTFNTDGTINVAGVGTGIKTARRFIPIGQGFFVQAIEDGNVTAKNSHRVFIKESSSDSEFFGIENNDKNVILNNNISPSEVSNSFNNEITPIPNDFKRFRLNIDFNDLYTRQLLQNFHQSATDGFDYGLETRSPQGVASDAYWVFEDQLYAAQAFNFREDLIIPLTITLAEPQSIRFRIFGIQNFDESQPIYLYDNETGLYTDLREQDLNINLPEGTFSDRFEIRFLQETLSTSDEVFQQFDVFQNNETSQLTIENPTGLDVRSVAFYDITGRRVFIQKNLPQESSYQFTTNKYNNGVYIVEIDLGRQSNFTKKVIISN